ncbi:carbon-nitrogen hydrolase family protein [Chromatiaceae bacterium AAb-1]|nr:carbon-nitrogen hydrolase family protein [Chromatiaceae bacterium AAb-1]
MAEWRLSAIQLNSTPDPQQNLEQVAYYLSQLPVAEHHLVVVPEAFAVFGGRDGLNLQYQAALGQGLIQQRCAELAQQYRVYFVAGSLPLSGADPERFSACSILFSPAGEILADYQKLHLFDVDVADTTGSYRESATTMPGSKVVLAQVDSLKLGMSICYDMRFPGLMQALAAQGMNVLAVPSAFTRPTGEAHWHTLLRARAIENQCFVIAPAQTGVHANGRETYGHSVIIDPWGKVLADAGTAPGWISVMVELNDCAALQRKMPVALHNRFYSELK